MARVADHMAPGTSKTNDGHRQDHLLQESLGCRPKRRPESKPLYFTSFSPNAC